MNLFCRQTVSSHDKQEIEMRKSLRESIMFPTADTAAGVVLTIINPDGMFLAKFLTKTKPPAM